MARALPRRPYVDGLADTGELIGRCDPFELHVAYASDNPIDRGGLSQSVLYVIVAYGFDFHDVIHPPASPPPGPPQ